MLGAVACGSSGGGSSALPPGAGGGSGWPSTLESIPSGPALDTPCGWHGVGHASDLSFSPDGALLVVAGGNYLKAFNATKGDHVFSGTWQPAELFSLAFSGDGQWLVTFAPGGSSSIFAGGASVLPLMDPAQGRALDLGEDVHAAGFSADSTLLALALASPSAKLELYSVPSFDLVTTVNQSDLAQGSTLAMSTDGRLLTYRGTITFRTSTGAPWFGALAPPNSVSPALLANWSDYAPASNISAAIDDSQQPSLSTDYHQPMNGGGPSLSAPDGPAFSSLQLSHGGLLLAAGQGNGKVLLWQLGATLTTQPTLVRTLSAQTATIPALAFSPDDAKLAAASDDGTLYVWDVSTGQELWHAEGAPPALNGAAVLAASAKDARILVGGDAAAYALELTSDKIQATLSPDPALYVSPDQACAASFDGFAMVCEAGIAGGADAELRLDLLELDQSNALTGAATGMGSFTLRSAFALAPDHATLIEAIDNQKNGVGIDVGLWRWAVPNGSAASELAVLDRQVTALAYSADGNTLAGLVMSINSAPLRAWDAHTGAALGTWGITLSLDATTFFTRVAIAGNGSTAAAVDGFNPDIALFQPRAGSVRRLVPSASDGNSGYDDVAISDDGSRIAVIASYRSSPAKGIVPHSTLVFASDGTPVVAIAGYSQQNPRPLAFLDQRTLLRGERDGTLSSWCLP